jgi:sodium-dependent phosphate cotransporter
LSMGLLSFVVTGFTYALGLFIGIAIMQMGLLGFVHIGANVALGNLMDWLYTPLAQLLLSFFPRWSLFLLGMGIIILSFKLFDRCLPQMAIKESHVGGISRLVYRPWVMFILGALVTLISMSVSMSLSILVPLSSRGFVRRENVIPYIMGANITTFIDTLFAALLFENPYAFVIVLTEIVSIVLVSLFILIFAYRHYERIMLQFVARVTDANRNVLFFMIAILLIPMLLLLI